jgi:hypothetical protein
VVSYHLSQIFLITSFFISNKLLARNSLSKDMIVKKPDPRCTALGPITGTIIHIPGLCGIKFLLNLPTFRTSVTACNRGKMKLSLLGVCVCVCVCMRALMNTAFVIEECCHQVYHKTNVQGSYGEGGYRPEAIWGMIIVQRGDTQGPNNGSDSDSREGNRLQKHWGGRTYSLSR